MKKLHAFVIAIGLVIVALILFLFWYVGKPTPFWVCLWPLTDLIVLWLMIQPRVHRTDREFRAPLTSCPSCMRLLDRMAPLVPAPPHELTLCLHCGAFLVLETGEAPFQVERTVRHQVTAGLTVRALSPRDFDMAPPDARSRLLDEARSRVFNRKG